jgi:hypothetical protein
MGNLSSCLQLQEGHKWENDGDSNEKGCGLFMTAGARTSLSTVLGS